jgi:hypothetical protein
LVGAGVGFGVAADVGLGVGWGVGVGIGVGLGVGASVGLGVGSGAEVGVGKSGRVLWCGVMSTKEEVIQRHDKRVGCIQDGIPILHQGSSNKVGYRRHRWNDYGIIILLNSCIERSVDRIYKLYNLSYSCIFVLRNEMGHGCEMAFTCQPKKIWQRLLTQLSHCQFAGVQPKTKP